MSQKPIQWDIFCLFWRHYASLFAPISTILSLLLTFDKFSIEVQAELFRQSLQSTPNNFTFQIRWQSNVKLKLNKKNFQEMLSLHKKIHQGPSRTGNMWLVSEISFRKAWTIKRKKRKPRNYTNDTSLV